LKGSGVRDLPFVTCERPIRPGEQLSERVFADLATGKYAESESASDSIRLLNVALCGRPLALEGEADEKALVALHVTLCGRVEAPREDAGLC
jgi:hypothetical protein